MVRTCLAAFLTISAWTGLLTGQQTTFRAETQTVPLFATVLGPDRRLVTDLTAGDFEILDNGRPQKITLFDSSIQAISIIVMLDMSGSMTGNIRTLKSAAVQMFTRLLPDDQARVGNFGYRIEISPRFTNDQDELIRALWLDLEPGGPTPLWGAVHAAMTGLAHVEGRRVVLVLSDGRNTGIRQINGLTEGPTLGEIMQRAENEDFMIYAIGMRSRTAAAPPDPGSYVGGRPRTPAGGAGTFGSPGGRSRTSDFGDPDPGLRQLAEASGGGYFELAGTENLGPIFARVADELHRQYAIGYAAPEADGKVHQVEVRVKPAGMSVRSRKTYLAPRPPTS